MKRQNEKHRDYFLHIRQQCHDCESLLGDIAETQGQGKSWREEVVEHCRTYSVAERTMWHYLSCYVEQRTFRLDDCPTALFRIRDEHLRQQILFLIPRVPKTALPDFKKLLNFAGSFLDRMTYLCDSVLNSFLSNAHREDPMLSSVLYAERLVMKLDEEMLRLYDSIVINTIAAIDRSYKTSLEEEIWRDEQQ